MIRQDNTPVNAVPIEVISDKATVIDATLALINSLSEPISANKLLQSMHCSAFMSPDSDERSWANTVLIVAMEALTRGMSSAELLKLIEDNFDRFITEHAGRKH